MRTNKKVLTKSKHGLVSGTLRGFANYYDLNLNGLQFVFVVAAFFGIGFLAYFMLWLSIPSYKHRDVLLTDLESRLEQ